MKIAFITYELPPDTGKGGIGTYTTQIATALTKDGATVHIFAGSHSRHRSYIEHGITIHRVACENLVDFKHKVAPVFADIHNLLQFDLVESPEIHGNASEIKKVFPAIPLVVRMHAPGYLVEKLKKRYVPFFAKLRYFLGALRRLKFDLGYWRKYDLNTDPDHSFIKMADFITAPSSSMKDWAIRYWKIPQVRITVLPNLFEPPQQLLEKPVSDGAFKTVLFFGRLNVIKGLVNATKAMKKILVEFPEWKFKVIGDNEMGPKQGIRMKEWMEIQLSQVRSQVLFLDSMEYGALMEEISHCEIVVLPSLFESFSYTCAEAMAAGKAIVGSTNGGMADLLKHQVSGLLADPENPGDIYECIKLLITDSALRESISVNARQSVLHDHSAVKTTTQAINYYKHVIAESGKN